jgi:RNA polymerase sigma factor for flagellar operon FliA
MDQTLTDQTLWDQYLTNRSPEIREQLILQAVPLAYYILNRLGINCEGGDEYSDLANQGLLGLIDAVDHYDPSFGTQFSTYASLRIRGKILDYLRSADWMTRSARKRVHDIRKVISDFWNEQQREPTDEEISQRLNLDLDSVKQGIDDSRMIFMSIDTMFDQTDEREGDYYEEIKDENQANPEDELLDSDQKAQLVKAIQSLPEREQQVLSLYYVEEFTYKEIGRALGISESRVCQIHSRALINIKATVKDE